MKVTAWIIPLVVVATLLGSVGVGKAFGWWQTSGRSIATLENASPEDVRGSSTLADISTAFGIPLDDLRQLLGIPTDIAPETKMKDLEEYNEVSVARGLIAEYLGLPWEWDTEEAPPLTETVPAPETPPESEPTAELDATEHTGPTPLPEGEILPAAEIKGRMTLQEVSEQCGIPLDVLYRELELDEGLSPKLALKDLVAKVDGLEVTAVRDVVAAYQAGQ